MFLSQSANVPQNANQNAKVNAEGLPVGAQNAPRTHFQNAIPELPKLGNQKHMNGGSFPAAQNASQNKVLKEPPPGEEKQRRQWATT